MLRDCNRVGNKASPEVMQGAHEDRSVRPLQLGLDPRMTGSVGAEERPSITVARLHRRVNSKEDQATLRAHRG